MNTRILNIETTTKNCSVSISENGTTIAIKEINGEGYSHAENLHSFIEAVLKESNTTYQNLAAIAISKGPGSYTGLRIGVSASKGLSFSLEIPLIATDTLRALANVITITEGVVIPVLDARRMEVYQAVFDSNNKRIQETKAQVVSSDTYDEFLNKEKVYFVGDAVVKLKTIIKHPNAVFIENKFPSSNEMGLLSYKKYENKSFEDVAYFEPYYLKDFIVVKSTKKYF